MLWEKEETLKNKHMKKTDIALLFYIVALVAALTLVSSCTARHPKCAAYDCVDPDPLFKSNLERSLYK